MYTSFSEAKQATFELLGGAFRMCNVITFDANLGKSNFYYRRCIK